MEAFKKALAEAEEGAVREKATREKHEAGVGGVQPELQDAVKKFESLERKLVDQESELAKAYQSAQDARVEAQGTLQEVQEARKIAAVRPLLCRANM